MMSGLLGRCAAVVLSVVCVHAVLASEPPKEAPAASASAVRIGYFANITHAQAILAMDSGDFAKALAPASVTTKVFNAGPSLIEALFAGEIDIGYVGPSPALAAHMQSRGRGIRVVAGGASGGVVIVAAPNSGIEKLSDLKGKRVATPQLGNTQDVSARHYMVTELGQANADNVVPVANAEQASMMSRGQIDAAWTVEPWGARLVAEAGGKIIAQEKDLWPDHAFALTLVVTTPEFLRDHPDCVERALATHVAWTKRLTEEPTKYTGDLAKGIEKLSGKKMSEAIVAEAVSRVTFTVEPLEASLKTFAKWAVELKQARAMADVSTLLDTTILRKVAPEPVKVGGSAAVPTETDREKR